MIYVDSWVWVGFFSKRGRWKKANHFVEHLTHEKGVVSSIGLTEIRYVFLSKYDKETADQITYTVESFKNLEIIPVTADIATYAADLHNKYYQKGDKISYRGGIHLATAILTGCTMFYSGNRDFKNVDEIDTEII
ncbi:MAG: PIN domain-containing protein [Candidatus Methanofastidiosia archaeon]|jgi:predicted nucleic acid-binding protein